jgi:hypothetical protein
VDGPRMSVTRIRGDDFLIGDVIRRRYFDALTVYEGRRFRTVQSAANAVPLDIHYPPTDSRRPIPSFRAFPRVCIPCRCAGSDATGRCENVDWTGTRVG